VAIFRCVFSWQITHERYSGRLPQPFLFYFFYWKRFRNDICLYLNTNLPRLIVSNSFEVDIIYDSQKIWVRHSRGRKERLSGMR
jgi:hypothetical protein